MKEKKSPILTPFQQVNFQVMTDTKHLYETDEVLIKKVKDSIIRQTLVLQEEYINESSIESNPPGFAVTPNRCLHEARLWAEFGYKVAVLNFANNHSIGGAPFFAGAQEESICRCTTLLPCLEDMSDRFYNRHKKQFMVGEIDHMGNDDVIYTPNVCVFKEEQKTGLINPSLMKREDWFHVDIITCAAPELWHGNATPSNYEEMIECRIKRILDVAQTQGAQILILGAWGCGVFANPADVVARVFHRQLEFHSFDTAVFAMGGEGDIYATFEKEFICAKPVTFHLVRSLLFSTGRENIDKTLLWLSENNFFEAPASVIRHNNFKGGLVKHSLDTCKVALRLNTEAKLSRNSVILCSLLHDVCKSDQYALSEDLIPYRIEENKRKGHGRRSMFILKRTCQLPLNYDEEMSIWWHMGEYEDSKSKCMKEYEDSKSIPLCSLIQKADGYSASSFGFP